MKKSLEATSIIEAIIVLLIVVTGITGVYGLLTSSQNLANSTSNRIQAIQIARDGLEAVTNIRDTNWILFAADYENCWNALNYNYNCIGNTWNSHRILWFQDGSNRRPYRLSKNSNNRFELEFISYPTSDLRYWNSSFRNDFRVWYDANGFYTQWASIVTDTNPLFTRYLIISYPSGSPSSSTIRVRSVVQWFNRSSSTISEVILETELKNWKAKQ